MQTKIIFLFLSALVEVCSSLTRQEYADTHKFMFDFFDEKPEKIPVAVRLGFHSCVGGCDGCINFDDAGNAGLLDYVEMQEVIFNVNKFDNLMSRADFYALSTVAAIDVGIQKANKGCPHQHQHCKVPPMDFPFDWGRVDYDSDSPHTPETTRALPSSRMENVEMFAYFKDNFGLGPRLTTALMGAHTLGGAEPENSGHEGDFVEEEANRFNNKFYQNMFDKEVAWNQVISQGTAGQSTKWRWDGYHSASEEKVGMMLNTDFELLYAMGLNEEGEADCEVQPGGQTCNRYHTYEVARLYSRDVRIWMKDFGFALRKMLYAGYRHLQHLE